MDSRNSTFWERKKAELEYDIDNIDEIIDLLKQIGDIPEAFAKERISELISTITEVRNSFVSEIETCDNHIEAFYDEKTERCFCCMQPKINNGDNTNDSRTKKM